MCTLPAMADLQPYNHSTWQQQYATHAFKSIVVDLTQDFVDFLQEGGIVVSSSSNALPQRGKPTEIVVQGVDYDPEDSYSSDSEHSGSEHASDYTAEQLPWAERFPELHFQIESAIEQLGGQVAPKLNWSSPTDALWISSYNSLKCCNADQVILMMKSSDRVMHDLEQLQDAQQYDTQQDQQEPQQQHQQQNSSSAAAAFGLRPQLVLRKWHDLPPEREFRCFVHQHKLVAISQRDATQHFPQLSLDGDLQSVKTRIKALLQQHIRDTFPVDSYALDVYVPASSSSSVKILDFNPICDTTSPLLFTWEELPYTNMHSADHVQQQQQQDSAEAGQLQQQQQQLAGQADVGQQQQQQQQQQEQQHVGGPFCQDPSYQQQEQQEQQRPATNVEIRVVRHAGMIMPGTRAATGMPVDMLGLQDSFEEVLRVMQQQQQQQQQQQ